MDGKCEQLLTDHKRLIICFTKNPYPVWIWTPDDASEEDMDRAYQLAALDGEHRFNLKYELANLGNILGEIKIIWEDIGQG